MSELTANNHGLMKIVRERIEAQYPMAFIAQELGVDLPELIHWIMDVYKAPRKSKAYVNRHSPALGYSTGEDRWSASTNTQRFSAWRKAQEGSARTRRMLEASER